MAVPYAVTPTAGCNLVAITTAADLALGITPDASIGQQVLANNGRRYVYAQAAGAIPASTATCTVPPTTFLATSTAGTYLSPAVAMATGDRGWFSQPSV